MNYQDVVFNKYKGKRLLLDSNLLLLLLVGSFQRERVGTFKRTSQFTTLDFDSLATLLTAFSTLVTTPHVLTEVSNLANSLPEYLKPAWSDHFSDRIATMLEVLTPAKEIAGESCFNPFGLTDAAIQNASVDTLILTEDFRVSGYLRAQGIDTLNFRDIALR